MAGRQRSDLVNLRTADLQKYKRTSTLDQEHTQMSDTYNAACSKRATLWQPQALGGGPIFGVGATIAHCPRPHREFSIDTI